jgi:hypothetical protein
MPIWLIRITWPNRLACVSQEVCRKKRRGLSQSLIHDLRQKRSGAPILPDLRTAARSTAANHNRYNAKQPSDLRLDNIVTHHGNLALKDFPKVAS